MLENADLGFIDKLVSEAFHQDGPGRPPRKPLGIFKAHIAKRFLGIRSIRELERKLWNDPRLRHLCDLEADEPVYGRSVLSRFPQRVGMERLERIIDHVLKGLKRIKLVEGKNLAIDASFIKAYSRINMKTRQGYSDPEAQIGRSGKGYGLGYNLHLSIDADVELPIAFTVTPANIRDIQEASNLLKATRKRLKDIKHLIADRGYSSDPFRKEVRKKRIEPIIPYSNKQRVHWKGILRIDKQFKPHGPTRLKRLYKKRNAIERVFSRLKEQLDLTNHKTRGIRNLTLHIQLCLIGMLLNAQTAINTNKPSKTLSITYYAT